MFYFSDQAWFHLESYINRLPRSKIQYALHKKSLQLQKKRLVYGVCCLASIQFIPCSLRPQLRVCEAITMQFISMLGFTGCY